MPDDVRPVWSEEELDRALAALRAEEKPDERLLARTRADLLAAAGAPAAGETVRVPVRARRRWTSWAAAAATVVALAAGLLAVVQVGDPPAANAVAEKLNSAADKIGASDPPVAPGQYRYVATHAWEMVVADEHFVYLAEHLNEVWAPKDVRQEWLYRGSLTGHRKWIEGSDAEAEAAGVEIVKSRPDEVRRAPCGDFYTALEGIEPCTFEGNWEQPNQQFMASLPRDPKQLYEELSAQEDSDSSFQMLDYVAQMLRTGLVPADLRAALYRTLAMVPGLSITEEVANLDGRKGIAFGIADDDTRQDVIIDPATGQFIGEREVDTKGLGPVPAGTTIEYTSVTTAVVDGMGDNPTG